MNSKQTRDNIFEWEVLWMNELNATLPISIVHVMQMHFMIN